MYKKMYRQYKNHGFDGFNKLLSFIKTYSWQVLQKQL